MKRIVILGTGTEVGKTYVTARLARSWRERQGPCLALKPVESGLEAAQPEDVSPWDDRAGALLPRSSGGRFPADLPTDSLSPASDAGCLQRAATAGRRPLYGFKEPISPHLAARHAHCTIELEQLQAWVDESINLFTGRANATTSSATSQGAPPEPERSQSRSLCLIETAGGAFSPLSAETTNADLPRALKASSILVAPNRLGVLHDVSSTLIALSNQDVTIQLVVLVDLLGADTTDASTSSNADELDHVVFPRLGRCAPSTSQVLRVSFQQETLDELAAIIQDLPARS